jgi:membrane protease YdiL (CAAX protease family)
MRIRGRLLFLSLIYVCFGATANYVHVNTENLTALFFLQYGMFFFWIALVSSLAYAVVRLGTHVDEFGFTHSKGGIISVAVVSVVSAYQCVSGNCLPAAIEPWFAAKAIGALVEELVFRMLLINLLISYFSRMRHPVLLALSLSAALFVIPHIPTKDISMLIGLFTTSMIMGFVYYKLRSILIPAWLHVVANTSSFGGIVMLVAYVVVVALDRLVISPLQRRNAQSPPVAPW